MLWFCNLLGSSLLAACPRLLLLFQVRVQFLAECFSFGTCMALFWKSDCGDEGMKKRQILGQKSWHQVDHMCSDGDTGKNSYLENLLCSIHLSWGGGLIVHNWRQTSVWWFEWGLPLLTHSLLKCWGKMSRCGLVGGGVSLRMGFDVSRANSRPRLPLYELLLQRHGCLLSAPSHVIWGPTFWKCMQALT